MPMIDRWLLPVLLGGGLMACTASTPPPSSAPANPVEVAAAPEAAPIPDTSPETYGSFSADELYAAIVAELTALRGDLPDATDDYYQLAFATRDLAIVRRATQFASASNDLNAVVQLGLLWAELAPDEREPHVLLTYHLLEAGRFEEAANHMSRVIELGGRMDFSALSRRTQRLSVERRNALIETLRDLHARYPGEDSIQFSVVELLDQNQRPQDALLELQALRQNYGDSPPTVLIEAQLLQKLGQDERARRVLRDGVRRYPTDRPLRFNHARALIAAEDYVGARREFAALVEQAPDDYETRYSIALIDLELEDFDRAEETFKTLLSNRHRTDEANYYLGFIHERRDDLERAVGYYRSVASGANNFIAAQQQATRHAITLGWLDEAHDWLVRLSQGQPRLDVLFTQIEASALIQGGHLARAGEMLDTALARHPNDTDLLFSRVLWNDTKGDLAASEADLRTIIGLAPDNSQALNHLGYMLVDRTTRYDEALDLLERAIALEPDDPAIIDSYGWVQYKLGNLPVALEYLQRAYAEFRDHEVASHLGEVLWVMGREAEARTVWNEALEERPDSELLKAVMQRFLP